MDELLKDYDKWRARFKIRYHLEELPRVLLRLLYYPFMIVFRLIWTNCFGLILLTFIPKIIKSVVYGSSIGVKYAYMIGNYECSIKYLWTLRYIHIFICDILFVIRPKSFAFYKRHILIEIYHVCIESLEEELQEISSNYVCNLSVNMFDNIDKRSARLTRIMLGNLLNSNLYIDDEGNYRINMIGEG